MATPQQFVQPTILLLREGTDTSQGRGQIIHNINACQAVADILKTTLGPRGMDKLIHDGKNVTISNDGATIIRLLDIVHPAAATLTDIARAQDAEVGDGTTTVVLLAGEFLKLAKPFIEDGVHSQIIIAGYRRACKVCIDKIDELAVDLEGGDEKEQTDMLIRCASTTLNSKLIASYKDFFAPMVVDAVQCLDEGMDLEMIGIKKIPGGSVTECQLVKGVAFRKTFAYAGFEQQPKRFENPVICCLNVELELKSEKETAEIRLSSGAEYQRVVDAEWKIIYDKLEQIANTKAKVVLSRLPIGDVATQYFADRDIFCAGRVAQGDLDRVCAATGSKVQTSLVDLAPEAECLGTCGLFEERQVGQERYNFFEQCTQARTCTMLLRGGAEQFIAETERSLHDAIMIVKRAIKYRQVVGGAGAIEMELSRYLKGYARKIKDKTALIMNNYARAFEVIPRQLATNAGLDATDIVNKLRYQHAKIDKQDSNNKNRWYGVDIEGGATLDAMESFIWEPALNKRSAIAAATEAACVVLSVDETIKNARSKNAANEKKVANPYSRPTGPVSIR